MMESHPSRKNPPRRTARVGHPVSAGRKSMNGWAQKFGAGFAALALLSAQSGVSFAQDSPAAQGQVSATPQGGFVLKMNVEPVLGLGRGGGWGGWRGARAAWL